ncbi:MAG: FAD binding domain-containing protein [Nocardioidaceae bacterium]
MKPAPFAYVRPPTVEDTLAELAAAEQSKILAGGQSLVPVLAMRLARPGVLVDINAVAGLDSVRTHDGTLRVGATVRQRALEAHQAGARVPLLGRVLPWVGHRELRSRGTVCGSLAHADPAAELPAVASCLDATLEVAGPNGQRRLPARGFFTGAMTTQLRPEEMLLSVDLPEARAGEGFGFAELARRHGDFAVAGVVVRVDAPAGDHPEHPRADLTCFGVSDSPAWRDVSEFLRAALADIGDDAPEAELAAALGESATAVADDVVHTDDAHGSSAYRKRVVAALFARELARAYAGARRTASEVTDR